MTLKTLQNSIFSENKNFEKTRKINLNSPTKMKVCVYASRSKKAKTSNFEHKFWKVAHFCSFLLIFRVPVFIVRVFRKRFKRRLFYLPFRKISKIEFCPKKYQKMAKIGYRSFQVMAQKNVWFFGSKQPMVTSMVTWFTRESGWWHRWWHRWWH